MLGDVNKLFVFKSLMAMPSTVLPLHLKQTFPPIIWIFTEDEGDGIESRLCFKIFSSLIIQTNVDKPGWVSCDSVPSFSVLFPGVERLIVELFVTECVESWTAESGLVGCFDLKFSSSSSCKTSDQFEPWLDLVSDIPSGLKLISRTSGPLANAWEFKADPNAESGSGLLTPDFKDPKKER